MNDCANIYKQHGRGYVLNDVTVKSKKTGEKTKILDMDQDDFNASCISKNGGLSKDLQMKYHPDQCKEDIVGKGHCDRSFVDAITAEILKLAKDGIESKQEAMQNLDKCLENFYSFVAMRHFGINDRDKPEVHAFIKSLDIEAEMKLMDYAHRYDNVEGEVAQRIRDDCVKTYNKAKANLYSDSTFPNIDVEVMIMKELGDLPHHCHAEFF